MRMLVEVGANDGSEQTKSAQLVKDGWGALMIEPCSYYYNKLVDRYADNDNVKCHNVAIALKEGLRDMYYVHPEDISARGLPAWVGLLGSFSLDHIKKHIFDVSVRIVKETVQCMPLSYSLKDNAVSGIDLLLVDVEGAEVEVMQTIPLEIYKPRYIELETKHLSRADRKLITLMLHNQDYRIAPLTDVFGNQSIIARKGKPAAENEATGRMAVVTLADKKFLPGLEVMVHSLLKHTDVDTAAWELVVLSNDLTEADLKRVKKLWSNMAIRAFDPHRYDKLTQALQERMPGANGSYNKFEIFGMSEFDHIVALDSDLLFLQDAYELFKSRVPIAAARELLIDQFNTGVMVLGHEILGNHTVESLIEMTEILGPREHADQDTISAYFYEEMCELPVTLNFLKTYYNYPFLQKFQFPPHIKVLHYIIHKPWLWDGRMNEIEIGTEYLNNMWVQAYSELDGKCCGKAECDCGPECPNKK